MERAKSKLFDDAEASKFNTARAVEVVQIAMERAVMEVMGSTGAITVRGIRGDGVFENLACDYVEDFKRKTFVEDQRASRTGLLSKLFGK